MMQNFEVENLLSANIQALCVCWILTLSFNYIFKILIKLKKGVLLLEYSGHACASANLSLDLGPCF